MNNLQPKESIKAVVEALNAKNNELRLLYETSRFFSTTLDINELYDKLFDVLRNIVDFQDMFVARFNEKERKIKYIYIRSVLEEKRIDPSPIPEIPLAPEGRGILSEAIRKNDTIVIHDYQERLKKSQVKYYVTNQSSLSETEVDKGYSIQSAMIVPIKLNGRILGFITIMSKNVNEFDEERHRWIETLINQAAIANKNAILFSEVQGDARQIQELESKLEETASKRNILLGEATNRVKENMKLISSLIQFQMDYVRDPVQFEYFKILKSRTSIVSLIHEKLYATEDPSMIDFETFLYGVIPHLYKSYEISLNRVSTYLNVKNIVLPVDKAITCALIVNELISHSLLHSFPNKKKGNITVDMHEESDGKYYLSVRDNGTSLQAAKGKPNSFSMVLVGMLVKDLKGSLDLDRSGGTKITIRF
jgi:two-component sensor histidine kinase